MDIYKIFSLVYNKKHQKKEFLFRSSDIQKSTDSVTMWNIKQMISAHVVIICCFFVYKPHE